ncbi:amidohydrolase [Halobaculum gomorrense]|uniref:Aminobenzoyl-glutamate utilization protein A n=1 Tax=Halobaculum gomorrense TaxID=43928 RepID=A0A1M5N636_9EURY|nr:amidohydrolase [Halobaculum gomorrense]SHG84971.1 aminobenzoyl-glutamate utilization protein A [Halobaculum gomorrense]
MSQTVAHDDLSAFRRDLHRHPEPAWCEFYTTARIVDELEQRDLTAVHYGPEILGAERMNVPDDDELDEWFERASDAGAREDVLAEIEGGYTGAVAVLERGEGPVVGVRVDIDALPILESEDGEHAPAGEGFRSEHEGYMHACGHDAHATFGLGLIDEVLVSEFEGTLKVFFQPGEEQIVGGQPMAESDLIDDVEYFLAAHVGLDHPTGEVICGIDGFLAVSHFLAEFEGEPSHAGGHPEQGRNTVQAAAAAIQNLYGIPRHAEGPTRVNAGIVGGGTATNIIPEECFIEGEVRGGTTEVMEYMDEKAETVIESAAEMHEVDVDVETLGRAPSATSDQELIDAIAPVAGDIDGVMNVIERDELGGSEDATYMMQAVQENGGHATYVGVGTDHPGGHHTSTFDVEEESLGIGVDFLTAAVLEIADRRP